jgi:hypothetical protein
MWRGLSVITWRKQIADPVVLWGQLLAYLPQVAKRLSEIDRAVFILPEPSLVANNVRTPADHLGRLASQLKTSAPELIGQQVSMMRRQLEQLGLNDLGSGLPP